MKFKDLFEQVLNEGVGPELGMDYFNVGNLPVKNVTKENSKGDDFKKGDILECPFCGYKFKKEKFLGKTYDKIEDYIVKNPRTGKEDKNKFSAVDCPKCKKRFFIMINEPDKSYTTYKSINWKS